MVNQPRFFDLECECASSGCDKIHFVHLVRSRGGAAFEQPIAAQSFGCFVIGERSSKLGDTPITKKPTAVAVGCSKAERTRFELAVELPLRQFSKLLVSATHPPLRKLAESIFNSDCKGTAFFDTCKSFARFFLKKHFKVRLSSCEFECCEYVPDNEKRGRRTTLLPRVYTF